jgi:hypothetical protein
VTVLEKSKLQDAISPIFKCFPNQHWLIKLLQLAATSKSFTSSFEHHLMNEKKNINTDGFSMLA